MLHTPVWTAEIQAETIAMVSEKHVGCYELIRRVYALAGVTLSSDPYQAMTQFRNVDFPEWGDVVLLQTHRFMRTSHVGLFVAGGNRIIHSVEGSGVVISRIDRSPWDRRVRACLRFRTTWEGEYP